MSTGMSDCISRLWVLRNGRGGSLSIDGHADEVEAIDRLIRHAIVWAPAGTAATLKTRIRAVVEDALQHDEPDEEDGGAAEEPERG